MYLVCEICICITYQPVHIYNYVIYHKIILTGLTYPSLSIPHVPTLSRKTMSVRTTRKVVFTRWTCGFFLLCDAYRALLLLDMTMHIKGMEGEYLTEALLMVLILILLLCATT
jgi:hypothetical protein